MDEDTARKIADHCLEPVAHELEISKCQQVAERIKTQLIIAHRTGVVKNWKKEMARENQLELSPADEKTCPDCKLPVSGCRCDTKEREALKAYQMFNRLHHDLDAYLHALGEWALVGELKPDPADYGLSALKDGG